MSFRISEYFRGVGVKRLSPVEIEPNDSNQHEFNGTAGFKGFFGTEKRRFQGRFIYMSDEDSEPIQADGNLTWYDARKRDPVRTEFRLYYTNNVVIEKAAAGDLLVIGWVSENKLLIIVAAAGSTLEQQLLWLFKLDQVQSKFTFEDFSTDRRELGFAGKYILSELGIEAEEQAPDYLTELLKRYRDTFPTTREFSDYSRSTVEGVDPLADPDTALMTWLNREEMLFKALERVIVKKRLQKGFGKDNSDVDEFIAFSLSVQNRRKARAGFSFEHNLVYLFSLHKLKFSRGAVTERNNKPDFIFPGINYYHNADFDVNLLTMLGVKTTAKDRWRQILAEAAKIPVKHLITLEPAISRNQTEDMRANNLHLIIPAPLINTYTTGQRKDIIDVRSFIRILKDRQKYLNK